MGNPWSATEICISFVTEDEEMSSFSHSQLEELFKVTVKIWLIDIGEIIYVLSALADTGADSDMFLQNKVD